MKGQFLSNFVDSFVNSFGYNSGEIFCCSILWIILGICNQNTLVLSSVFFAQFQESFYGQSKYTFSFEVALAFPCCSTWLWDLKMRQLWKINWGESLHFQTKHRHPKSKRYVRKCKYILYARHYNPRFVYFLPTFWSSKTFFQGAFFLKIWPYVWLVFKSGF